MLSIWSRPKFCRMERVNMDSGLLAQRKIIEIPRFLVNYGAHIKPYLHEDTVRYRQGPFTLALTVMPLFSTSFKLLDTMGGTAE